MTDANEWSQWEDNGNEAPPRKRSGCGCLAWGCLAIVLLTLLAMIAAGVGGYYWLKGQVEKYTDEQPLDLPIVEPTDEQSAELEQRVESFKNRIGMEDDDAEAAPEEGDAPEADEPAPAGPRELVLTANDLNFLISMEPDLRGRAHVTIEEGKIAGEVSIPTDELPIAGGRYFNAKAVFEVSMRDGFLLVRAVDAEVKGERLPDVFLDGLKNENLASDIANNPDVAPLLENIESIRVEGDKLILVAKPVAETKTESSEQDQEVEAGNDFNLEVEENAQVETATP